MRREFLALPVMFALAGAARAESCAQAYKPDFEAQWRIPRAAWEKGCAEGREAEELMRAFQRGFMTQCAARLKGPAAAAKTAESGVQAYCAQGVAGEVRLAGQLGVPLPSSKPRPAPAPARPAAADGMGPLAVSLEEARKKWHPDACLALLEHHYTGGETKYDNFKYYFWSPAAPRESFGVTWQDRRFKKVDAPESAVDVYVTDGGCLGAQGAGIDQALAAARGMGLALGGTALFTVTLYSPGAWKGWFHSPQLPPDQAPLAAGKVLWTVAEFEGRTAVVDASNGKGLFLIKQ